MSGLYFESFSLEGLLDVLNALILLQIEFATLVYMYNNQTYGIGMMVKGTYEFVIHLTLQLIPRHRPKLW